LLCRRSLVGGMQSNTEEEKDFSVQRTVTVDHHQMGLGGGAWGGTRAPPAPRRELSEVRRKKSAPTPTARRAHSTSFFYAACTALVAGARPTPRAAHSTPCQAHYYNMALNERLLSGEEPLRSRSCVAPVAIASAGLIALTLTVLTASSRANILNMEGSSTTQRHHVHEIALVNFIRHGERNQNPADTGLTAASCGLPTWVDASGQPVILRSRSLSDHRRRCWRPCTSRRTLPRPSKFRPGLRTPSSLCKTH